MFSSKLRSTRLIVFDLRKFSPFSESEKSKFFQNEINWCILKSEMGRFVLKTQITIMATTFWSVSKIKVNQQNVFFLNLTPSKLEALTLGLGHF